MIFLRSFENDSPEQLHISVTCGLRFNDHSQCIAEMLQVLRWQLRVLQ